MLLDHFVEPFKGSLVSGRGRLVLDNAFPLWADSSIKQVTDNGVLGFPSH